MENSNSGQDDLLKQLIYSQRARSVLLESQEQGGAKRVRLYTALALAAAVVVVVLGVLMLMRDPSAARQQYAEAAYEFPTYVKSRGSQLDGLSSQYADRINSGNRAGLAQIYIDSASTEEDFYFLAHLLFEEDQLADALVVLDSVAWQDPYLEGESKWLEFLIGIRLGESDKELQVRYRSLDTRHKSSASQILEVVQ